MQNRRRLAGVMAAVVLAFGLHSTAGRAFCRSEFFKYFEGLGTAEASVNPVERLVFSALLATTGPECQNTPVRRLSANGLTRLF